MRNLDPQNNLSKSAQMKMAESNILVKKSNIFAIRKA